MTSGISVLSLSRTLAPEILPSIEPHLVEVVIPISTGTVDEAVRQAGEVVGQAVSAAIAQLTAGSPAELDTFLEAYNRFLAGESAAAALAAVVASKAPLASPALTGVPTAPLAPLGTSSAQVASTAFVATAIASLVNSSPAALDTLNELAAALGSDPDFATTIAQSLALKAPLASPAFSGAPTAPTAGRGSSNTQIATTGFVAEALANLVGAAPEALNTIYKLATQVEAKAASDRRILTEGLAEGGGDLSSDRTIKVSKATMDQAQAAIDDASALTPATGLALAKAQAVAVLKAWRVLLPTSADGLASGEPYLNGNHIAFVP